MNSLSTAISVTEVTRRIKGLLEKPLSDILVRGEISNFKHHSSGHMYFIIKDQGAELKCVMFRGYNQYLHFKAQDGMDVLLIGDITVYERRGNYQLLVKSMEPAGIGTLYLAFEALKKQLASEGLFLNIHKKRLPVYPVTVAIITSKTGAALRDILHILARRAPQIKVLIRSTLVQGDGAVDDLVAALLEVETHGKADVIIIARGGGSLEDLWPFNEEKVARAIYACSMPIISGVGHETDTTICDLVADLRAPTPSAAAEMISFSQHELMTRVTSTYERMEKTIRGKLQNYWQHLDHLGARYVFQRPQAILDRYYERLSSLDIRLGQSMHHHLSLTLSRLDGIAKKLEILNPFTVLERGYSVAFNSQGKIVKNEGDLKIGESFTLQTGHGSLWAEKKKTIEPGIKQN